MPAAMRERRLHAKLVSMSPRSLIVLAMLSALLLVAAAQARPLTTAPSLSLDVHVTLTNTRIVLDRHSAPRGVQARFVIKNTGTKAHNFTLNGKTSPTGVRQDFSRTLKPHLVHHACACRHSHASVQERDHTASRCSVSCGVRRGVPDCLRYPLQVAARCSFTPAQLQRSATSCR
jgi:hypothetical protein